MSSRREKVVVAMSGGVDSSVAAHLLVEQGFDVIGLFMRVGAKETPSSGLLPVLPSGGGRAHQGCCSAADAADARFVAGKLGIPFYALNFEEEFDKIIDYFADEYARGRTPNPCVVCNDRVKFGRLLEYADAVGASHVATGHYARIGHGDSGSALCRAVDDRKDQTYVLFGLRREVLDRVMFPIGHLTKHQVRAIAAKMGFPNHDKPDSVEICFAPNRSHAEVVRRRRPEAFVSGEVVDSRGEVIGRHDGIVNYTIGQRRGLHIAAGKPIYITALDAVTNRVTIGEDRDLLCDALIADRVNLQIDPGLDSFRAEVKIRYLHGAAPATVERMADDRVRVVFDEPQRAVTPGQAVVFYDGELVLGGAWIESGQPVAAPAVQELAAR